MNNVTNFDNSNSTLQKPQNNLSHSYNSGYINKLNNSINNNKDNNEEALSTTGNLNKEEIEQNSIKNSPKKNSMIINTNSHNEKLNNTDNNSNDIQSINSYTKIKNIPIKKTQLQEYLQSGYKKYPHAKNERKLIQHYEYWEGYNYFPYKGHIIEGPCSFRPTMASGLAVTLPIGLFIGFNASYITDHWTKAILIIAGVLCLLVLIFLILCSFRDPGIIRRHHFNCFYRYERKGTRIFQLGFIRNYKYCGTCSIMRPIRSSHCFDCNNCVERCDHHCPWIGNCVGKRNYLFFYFFVISLTFMLLYLEGFCIAHIWKYLHDNLEDNKYKKGSEKREHIVAYSLCDLIISLYLIIYGILCMAFTLGLLFYHTSLVINNTTTKEMLKFLWKNPFGNSFNRNCDYNLTNSLLPEIKKYSILDILRNGKKEKREIDKQNFYSNQYNNYSNNFNNPYNYNNNFNNNNINKNYIDPINNNKQIINIDINQDINDIMNEKMNYENKYIKIDDNTFNNSLNENKISGNIH